MVCPEFRVTKRFRFSFLDIIGLTLDVIRFEVNYSDALRDAILYLLRFTQFFYYGLLTSLFLALASIGVGILLLRDPAPLKYNTTMTVAIRCAAGFLTILIITFVGLSLDHARSVTGSGPRSSDRAVTTFLRAQRVRGVIKIFLFIASVAVLGFAIFLQVKVAKAHAQLQKVPYLSMYSFDKMRCADSRNPGLPHTPCLLDSVVCPKSLRHHLDGTLLQLYRDSA
jgi:hypothetical protein